MKPRHTLWLILVFVAFFLYLAFVEAPNKQEQDEAKDRSKKVLLFKVEDVVEFDLIKPSGKITIRRNPKNQRWNIVEPMAVEGEDGVINQLLLALEEAEITRVVDEEPKNLGDFGLENATFKMVLRFKTGEPKTLLMGDPSPIDNHEYYLKLADEKRVLLTLLSKNHVNLPLGELRNKLLLNFVPRDVTAVDLKFNNDTQRFVKEGGIWKLTAPVNALGDPDEISNFLNNIRSERIKTFISETPENIAPLGLEKPHIVLNIHAEKAKQSWTLKVGKAFNRDSYYAQRGQPDNVITIADSLVETLSKNPLSFMEKSLITFKEDEIAAIEIREGTETTRVVRNSGNMTQWEFKNPENGTVDSATVNTLLLDLQEARIEKFSPNKNLELFGLNTPKKEFTLFKKDGSKLTLRLGNTDTNKEHSFVLRSADQSIFELDANTVKKIFRARSDFKDRKLLKFDPEQVSRIKIEYTDKTFELEKQDNQWVLTQPEKLDDLKPFAGKDILWTLSNLEYETKSTPGKVSKQTGLEKPHLVLTLKDSGSKMIGQLKIGQPVKDQPHLYSQLTGDTSLYSIKDRTLGEIPSTLDQFRKKKN